METPHQNSEFHISESRSVLSASMYESRFSAFVSRQQTDGRFPPAASRFLRKGPLALRLASRSSSSEVPPDVCATRPQSGLDCEQRFLPLKTRTAAPPTITRKYPTVAARSKNRCFIVSADKRRTAAPSVLPDAWRPAACLQGWGFCSVLIKVISLQCSHQGPGCGAPMRGCERAARAEANARGTAAGASWPLLLGSQ